MPKKSSSTINNNTNNNNNNNNKEITEKIISGRQKAKRIENEKQQEEHERRLARERKRREEFGSSSSSASDNDDNSDSDQRREKKSKSSSSSSFTTGQFIGHLALALIFISFPLSEPGIDWEGVAYLIGVNALFNFIVRASSISHVIILSLINIVTLQWYRRVPHLWMALLSMGPVRLSATIGGNAFALVCGYFLYIRRQVVEKSSSSSKKGKSINTVVISESKTKKLQLKAWDKFLSSLIIVNVLILIFVFKSIGLEEVKLILRGLASLFMNLPQTGPGDEQTQMHGMGTDPGSGIPNVDPNSAPRQTFKGAEGVEAEFF